MSEIPNEFVLDDPPFDELSSDKLDEPDPVLSDVDETSPFSADEITLETISDEPVSAVCDSPELLQPENSTHIDSKAAKNVLFFISLSSLNYVLCYISNAHCL